MERLHPDRLAEQVDVVAHHATHGAARDRAVRYLRQAGAKAVARSAVREAADFFEHALAILGELPETPETLSEALDIRIALGPALIGLTSAAAPEVVKSYDHAQELVERLGDTARRFPVIWGRWFISLHGGRLRGGADVGERLLDAARSGEDSGRLVEAHHALWATFTAMGAPAAAIPHAERASRCTCANGTPRRCSRTAVTTLGPVAAIGSRSTSGSSASRIGPWPASATHSVSRPSSSIPLTETVTLWFASWVHYQRRDRPAAIEAAERLQSVAASMASRPGLTRRSSCCPRRAACARS